MTVASRNARADIEPLPEDLDSPQAKLVYLCLRQFENGATIEQIQSQIGLNKLTLYSLLRSLSGREYIECDNGCYYLDRTS